MEPDQNQNAFSRRIEWIAVILLALNLLMTIYATELYYDNADWARAAIALHTTASVLLLLTVIFTVFGQSLLPTISVSLGVAVFIVAIVSLGLRLIDIASNRMYY